MFCLYLRYMEGRPEFYSSGLLLDLTNPSRLLGRWQRSHSERPRDAAMSGDRACIKAASLGVFGVILHRGRRQMCRGCS